MQIWSRPKWAQIIASQHKCTQGLAERTSKLTQVFNLPLLATLFGQAFHALAWLITLTLVEIKLAPKLTQIFNHLATQPKSTQVEWRLFVVITTY